MKAVALDQILGQRAVVKALLILGVPVANQHAKPGQCGGGGARQPVLQRQVQYPAEQQEMQARTDENWRTDWRFPAGSSAHPFRGGSCAATP